MSTVRQATVCFSCGVGAQPINEHDLVYTLSNKTTVTYIKPQCTCKSSTLDELLCPVHCLKGLFEKATAPPQMENNTQIKKSPLHNCFRRIFPLKNSRHIYLNCTHWFYPIRQNRLTKISSPSLSTIYTDLIDK